MMAGRATLGNDISGSAFNWSKVLVHEANIRVLQLIAF